MVLPASELWGLNVALGGLLASAFALRSEELKNYPWIYYGVYVTGVILGVVVAFVIFTTQEDKSESADKWRWTAEILLTGGLITLSLLALKTKEVVVEVYKRASKQVTFAQ